MRALILCVVIGFSSALSAHDELPGNNGSQSQPPVIYAVPVAPMFTPHLMPMARIMPAGAPRVSVITPAASVFVGVRPGPIRRALFGPLRYRVYVHW